MELEEGKYYWTEWEGQRGDEYIFKHTKHESSNTEAIKNKNHYGTNYVFSQNKYASKLFKNLRIATTQEANWLNICIKADKFIVCPVEEIELLNSIELW